MGEKGSQVLGVEVVVGDEGAVTAVRQWIGLRTAWVGSGVGSLFTPHAGLQLDSLAVRVQDATIADPADNLAPSTLG